MSDNLNEMSIDYLMSKDLFSKYNKKKSNVNTSYCKKEKKFYKKRIYELTKQLLSNEKPDRILHDVNIAFDSYIKSCIEYFKVLDKTDIIQEDYTDFEANSNNTDIENIDIDIEESNKLMMRSIKIKEPNALEKLVKRTSTKIVQKQNIPLQKEINLSDPILKNKGIRKKKNITNNYDKTQEYIDKTNKKI